MITAADIAWAAGFIEGEGSFLFASITNRGHHTGQLRVCAPQVEREPLAKLQALFGGRLRQFPATRPNRQPQWRWEVTGHTAVGLMFTLYPLLFSKRRRQIGAAVEKWKALPGRGGHQKSRTQCPVGHEYTPENTMRYHRGNPQWRSCRTCASAKRRTAYHRNPQENIAARKRRRERARASAIA